MELLGQVIFPSALRPNVTFLSLSATLEAEGRLPSGSVSQFPFEFKHAQLVHESYHGRHMQIK